MTRRHTLPPRPPDETQRNGNPTLPADWGLEPPREPPTGADLLLAGVLVLCSATLVGLGVWKAIELVTDAL